MVAIGSDEGGAGAGRTVLLLESDGQRLDLVDQLLQSRDYRVIRVKYGREGQERLFRTCFDTAVWCLDDQTLDVGHLSPIFRLRFPHAKIIALAREPFSRQAILGCRALPLFDFLPLPLNGFKFLETVEQAFQQVRYDRERHHLVRERHCSAGAFQRLMDEFPSPFFVLDAGMKFTYLNRKLKSVLGLPESRCIGRDVSHIFAEIDAVSLREYLYDTQSSDATDPFRLVTRFTLEPGDGAHLRPVPGEKRLEVSFTAIRMPGAQSRKEGFLGCYGSVADVSRRHAAEQALNRCAPADPLENLPDQFSLWQLVEKALSASAESVAVLVVNLRNLSTLSALRGREFGEAVLRAAASCIAEGLRAGDFQCRYDSSGFAVLLHGIRTESDAASIAGKLAARLASPLQIGGGSVLLEVSIGGALSSADCAGAEDLLGRAVLAGKLTSTRQGRSIRFYESGMNQAVMDRMGKIRELRAALAEEQMEPFFQPLVNLRSGELVGFEALARWRSGRAGIRTPDDFLDLLADMGLVAELDDIIHRKAIMAMGRWNRKYGTALRVSLNVTTEQLARGNFLNRLLGRLRQAGLSRNLVTLEFVEYSHFPDQQGLLAKLSGIRDAGIRLAVDDFGTGYSSLSYLHQLPLDLLKIDRSFVRDMPGNTRGHEVIAAILNLARALGLDCIAEGIETPRQVSGLLQLGCGFGQGYLFGKPRSQMDTDEELNRLCSPAAGRPATMYGPLAVSGKTLRRRAPGLMLPRGPTALTGIRST